MDNDDDVEMEVRMIVATEGERVTDTNLEQKENFSLMFTSDKMEFLDRSEIYVKVSRNASYLDNLKLIIEYCR